MSPWRGQELEQEFRMAQESRARLSVRSTTKVDSVVNTMEIQPLQILRGQSHEIKEGASNIAVSLYQ